MSRIVKISSVAAVCALIHACGLPAHTEKAADIDPRGWSAENPARVAILNEDTVSVRDIGFFVRTVDGFDRSEVSVEVSVAAPDGTSFSEPFVFAFGEMSARTISFEEFDAAYRRKNILSQKGEYTFLFTPAETVRGIASIGVRISAAR